MCSLRGSVVIIQPLSFIVSLLGKLLIICSAFLARSEFTQILINKMIFCDLGKTKNSKAVLI